MKIIYWEYQININIPFPYFFQHCCLSFKTVQNFNNLLLQIKKFFFLNNYLELSFFVINKLSNLLQSWSFCPIETYKWYIHDKKLLENKIWMKLVTSIHSTCIITHPLTNWIIMFSVYVCPLWKFFSRMEHINLKIICKICLIFFRFVEFGW